MDTRPDIRPRACARKHPEEGFRAAVRESEIPRLPATDFNPLFKAERRKEDSDPGHWIRKQNFFLSLQKIPKTNSNHT